MSLSSSLNAIHVFDYDRVVVSDNPYAFQSLRAGIEGTLKDLSLGEFNETAFNTAINSASGTAEDYFFYLYWQIAMDDPQIDKLEFHTAYGEFVAQRAAWLRRSNLERGVEASDEGYIRPDFLSLVETIRQHDVTHHTRSWICLGTGNPNPTLIYRIPPEVRKIFDHVSDGEFARRRDRILEQIVTEAIVHQKLDPHTTMYYYDDSPRGIYDVATGHDVTFPFQLIHVRHQKTSSAVVEEFAQIGRAIVVDRLDEPRLSDFLWPSPSRIEQNIGYSKRETR